MRSSGSRAGLLHGLGFASALKEIGLPGQHLPLAACRALLRLAPRRLLPAYARVAALYAMGTVATWWSWTRVAAVLA